MIPAGCATGTYKESPAVREGGARGRSSRPATRLPIFTDSTPLVVICMARGLTDTAIAGQCETCQLAARSVWGRSPIQKKCGVWWAPKRARWDSSRVADCYSSTSLFSVPAPRIWERPRLSRPRDQGTRATRSVLPYLPPGLWLSVICGARRPLHVVDVAAGNLRSIA